MTRGKVPLIGIGSVFLFFRPDFNCEVRSMNSPLHTVSALLVSASEAQTKRIGALLTRARIVPFEHADSARQALDLFDAGGIDGVLIAEPVTGSSGQELALQLKKRRCMAVLLLAEPTHADAAAALLEQAGVLVLPGVTIGSNTIIGAGSVVNRNIPDGVIAAGNPCRVIRKITDADKKKYPVFEESAKR